VDIEFINGRRTLVLQPDDTAISALEHISMMEVMSVLQHGEVRRLEHKELASAVTLPNKKAVDQLRFFGLVEVHHRSRVGHDGRRLVWIDEVKLTDLGREVLEMAQDPSDEEIHVPA
jgi:hypothetical protein